jgi:hypothetical protein
VLGVGCWVLGVGGWGLGEGAKVWVGDGGMVGGWGKLLHGEATQCFSSVGWPVNFSPHAVFLFKTISNVVHF